MEDQKPYRVEFHAHLDDRARAALDAAGITVVGASGGATLGAEGGQLPDMDHFHVEVYAPGEGEAAGKVADALKGAGVPFTPIGVTAV